MASVTTMSGMFNRAIAFNREILGWNVNRVEDMSYMFESAFGFSRDVSAWNVKSVTAMTQIFSYAGLLSSSRTKGCLWRYWGATLQWGVTNDLSWSSSAREECQAARCVDMCMHACSVCSCPRGRTVYHTRTHTQARSSNGSMESVGRCDSCIALHLCVHTVGLGYVPSFCRFACQHCHPLALANIDLCTHDSDADCSSIV